MDWIKKRTHVIDHVKFLAAGPIARDLYDWGLLWSGEHETDGEIPMVAVLSSAWGAGCKANVKPAMKLVEVGLWEKTDAGFRSLKWAEQGNMTAAQLATERASARERKARRGSEKVQANSGRTNTEVPTSTSLSPSGYGSQVQIASTPDVVPNWFAAACDAAAMAIGGVVDDRPARWAEYLASRDRKGWAKNHGDAVGWLSTVVRSERAKVSLRPAARGAEITKQPFDPNAPWLRLPEVG